MSEVVDLNLITSATDEQLKARLEEIHEIESMLGTMVDDAQTSWEQATDPVAKQTQWNCYMAVLREYRVVSAWRGVIYSAYIFATEGADCVVLDINTPAT